MLQKRIFVSRAQKFIYGLLVLCLGGVGSLAYSDAFLPGHERHPYHLTIFEAASPDRNPSPPWLLFPAGLAASRFLAFQDFLVRPRHSVSSVARFFLSGLGSGFLLIVIPSAVLASDTFSHPVPAVLLAARPAWLALPEKPPD